MTETHSTTPWLSTTDVVSMLGYADRQTAINAFQAGEIPAPVMIRGQYRWDPEELIPHLKRQKVRRHATVAGMARKQRRFQRGRIVREQRGNGKSVWIGHWGDEDGFHRKILSRKSKAEASAILNQIIHQRDRRLAGFEDDTGIDRSLHDLSRRYVADLETKGRSATHVQRTQESLKSTLGALAVEVVGDLTREGVAAYRAERRKTAAVRTVNLEVSTLMSMLRWASSEIGLIARSPLEGLKPLPQNETTLRCVRRALSRDEMRRLVRAGYAYDAERMIPQGKVPQAPLLRALLETGARFGEMTQARWCDLGQSGLRLRAATTKASKTRTVPILPALRAELATLRKARGLAPDARVPMFLTSMGRPYKRSALFREALFRMLRIARIPRQTELGTIDVHALRHTVATELARNGVPVQKIAALLGHKGVKMVTNVYSHLDVSDVAREVVVLALDDDGCRNLADADAADAGKVGGAQAIRPGPRSGCANQALLGKRILALKPDPGRRPRSERAQRGRRGVRHPFRGLSRRPSKTRRRWKNSEERVMGGSGGPSGYNRDRPRGCGRRTACPAHPRAPSRT